MGDGETAEAAVGIDDVHHAQSASRGTARRAAVDNVPRKKSSEEPCTSLTSDRKDTCSRAASACRRAPRRHAMSEVELWRSYISGAILLGIAPCTAMVLMWGYLAKGNQGHTLVMVAINSLTMLVLYGLLGGWLLGVNKMPVPWQALLLSIAIYVALPLVAGYFSRKWIIKAKGLAWFEAKFLHVLTPVSIIALLATLVLLFSFKGETIIGNPLTILWIAIPLFIQTWLIFGITYVLAKLLKFSYEDAAPSAMIGASNHFEVAIATATMLFGLSSGAALATVVGVLIEVPVMLMLVKVCLRTRRWFAQAPAHAAELVEELPAP